MTPKYNYFVNILVLKNPKNQPNVNANIKFISNLTKNLKNMNFKMKKAILIIIIITYSNQF